jgi:Domain of unknown function (DUF4332)
MALSVDTIALLVDAIALQKIGLKLHINTNTKQQERTFKAEAPVTIFKQAYILISKMSAKHKDSRTTIQSRDWPIEQLPGLSHEEQSHLQSCGITSTVSLVKQGKTLESRLALANKLQIHLQYVNKWMALADLARIPSVGTQYCGLLLHAGIGSVVQLAQTPTHRLHQQIMRLQVATMQRRDLCPAIELVQQWSQQAKIVLSAEC